MTRRIDPELRRLANEKLERARKRNPSFFGASRGDVDNLAKSVLDGLNGIAWKDDAQVEELHVRLDRVGKPARTEVLIAPKGFAPADIHGLPGHRMPQPAREFTSPENGDGPMTAPTCVIHNTPNQVDDGAFFCVECGQDGLVEVTITVCEKCRDGHGGECHTPGCAFWMNKAPDDEIAVVFRIALDPDGFDAGDETPQERGGH